MTPTPVAVVTGCDYGLGAETAREGVARGWRVLAGCLKPGRAAALRALAAPLRQGSGRAHPGRLAVFGLDQSTERGVRAGAAAIRKLTKRVDLLVNVAGIYFEDGLDRVNFKDFQRMFAVNAFGPAVLVRALRPLLKAAQGAKIVNVTSESGSLATVNSARPILAYAASKAAANMLSRKQAFELKADGVKVIALHPGWMNTPMGRLGGPNPSQDPAATARDIFTLVERLDDGMSGGFFWHHGKPFPW